MTEKSYLQTVLEHAGIETRSYSGRAMYGAKCVACDQAELGEILSVLVRAEGIDEDERDDLAHEAEGIRSDSMGLGVVYYWPKVAFVEEEDLEPLDSPEHEREVLARSGR
jgi:hypothetical protein